MSKFESNVKQIPYSQQSVYEKLSDLSNIEKVKDRLPEDKAKDLEFTSDSISISVAPVGRIQLQIIEREEPKTIKFETVQSPMPFNLWIQLLPTSEASSNEADHQGRHQSLHQRHDKQTSAGRAGKDCRHVGDD